MTVETKASTFEAYMNLVQMLRAKMVFVFIADLAPMPILENATPKNAKPKSKKSPKTFHCHKNSL